MLKRFYIFMYSRVQILKMALKRTTFCSILKAFSSDTPKSIERQNKVLKKHDGKYISVVPPSSSFRIDLYMQTKGHYCVDRRSSFFLSGSSGEFSIGTRY